MIYHYDIAEAMRDKVVKRVIVFKPDIEKVKFTYYDLETKKEIASEKSRGRTSNGRRYRRFGT